MDDDDKPTEEELQEDARRGFKKIVDQYFNKKFSGSDNIEYPEYVGLSFEEFWHKLDHKIELFDYEEELFDTFQSTKKIWIKKSTGLGITEFIIRWIAWRCLSNNIMKNQQVDTNVVMITGPRIDLAITVMNRLKALLPNVPKGKETVCVLNGNRIEAFPSHHLASTRGLNPQIVFLDEADFFPPGQQQEARMVSERYIAKTDPHIIMVSTPNLPGGLYDEMEAEEKSIYKRITWNWEIGYNKIYTPEDIRKAKESPSFEREYNLQYGFGIGDIFSGIDDIISMYDLDFKGGRACTTGDPAFGSSKFGVVSGESLDGIAYVKEAGDYARPSPSAMLDVLEQSWKQHNGSCKIDAAHPGFIRDLNDRSVPAIPVNFGLVIPDMESNTTQSLRSKMTINASQMVRNKQVRIHPNFKTLIAQMRAVRFDPKGGIDKSETSFDVVDAFIMWCYDMKEFDYKSTHVGLDGTINKDFNVKKSESVIVKVEKFE